jgi:hypothetical protein
VRLAGQTFLVDLVMVAPRRFSDAVRTALEVELPNLRPALIRARFHLREEGEPAEVAATLTKIKSRGTHGILLKAHDHPLVARAVDDLAAAGIPTVTLATDIPASRRVGYVGIDNRAAGATAAYVITKMAGAQPGSVLISLSSSTFHGEEERGPGSGQPSVILLPAVSWSRSPTPMGWTPAPWPPPARPWLTTRASTPSTPSAAATPPSSRPFAPPADKPAPSSPMIWTATTSPCSAATSSPPCCTTI